MAIHSPFVIILFTSSLVHLPLANSETENITLAKFAFVEVVNSSLFYQSYSPLVFKLRVPDWKVENLRLKKSLKCTNDDLSSAGDYMCPVAYHIEGLLSSMSQSMRFYKHVTTIPGGTFYEENFSCNVIKPHFDHFSTHLGGLLPYIEEFRNRCPLGKNATLTIKNVDNSAAQHAVIGFEKFKQLHENSRDNNYSRRKFLDMANYAAFQNTYVFYQYVDSVRFANAFKSCQSYKLDIGLVNPVMLNESLIKLSKSLTENGYDLTLPYLSSLAQYYKLPIVDCILTLSNTPIKASNPNANSIANLVFRLLIPVIKTGVNYKIVNLNKIPFIQRKNTDVKICEIRNFESEDGFIVEENLSLNSVKVIGKVSPSCLTSILCKVPDDTNIQFVDPCVTGIITENQTLVSKFCSFDCASISGNTTSRDKRFPIFTQISSNQYVIIGLAPKTFPVVFIQCHGQKMHMFNPNTDEGVIFVTLPCNCELSRGTERFSVQQPCYDPIAVNHVIKLKKNNNHDGWFEIDKDLTSYGVESLNTEEFTLTFTEFTTEAPAKVDINETKIKPKRFSKTQLHCGHVLLWIFLISQFLVNLFIFLILYKHGIIGFNTFYLW